MTRRSQVHGRGYFGIGIERGKTPMNLGTLWRSAVCFGAGYIFTIGSRYQPQASDTVKSWRHIPLWSFKTVSEFVEHAPYDSMLVGVELTESAKSLETYTHPRRCSYLLGPEDGSLSKAALSECHDIVQFTSAYCLNQASAGTVVLYDRQAKDARS